MRKLLCFVLIAALAVPFPQGALASYEAPEAVAHGLSFVRAEQEVDGSISGSAMLTQWAVMTVASAGEDPRAWRVAPDTPSLLDAVETQYAQLDVTKPTDWARAVLAVVAAGEDPRSFGGHDWLAVLRAHHVQNQTGYPPYVNDDLFAVLALRAAGVSADDAQVKDGIRVLRESQYDDGSWGYAMRDPGPSGHSPDLTGMALCALSVAGAPPDDAAILRGLDFLEAVQIDDGSFPMAPGGSTGNPWSTAWVVPGLGCAGEDANGARWAPAGASPLDWLTARAFEETSTWGMIELVRALAYPEFPVHPPPPVADLLASTGKVGRGDAVAFDATGSRHPWFDDLAFRWDFGDGTVLEWGPHARVEHAFEAPGLHRVQVEVKSVKTGATAQANVTVDAYNRAPSLTVPSGLSADRITTPAWDAVSATDADGDALVWLWDFGDGATARCDASGCVYGDGTESLGNIPTHRYGGLGEFTVGVAVTDGYGGEANATLSVTVLNLVPSARLRVPAYLQGTGPHPLEVAAWDPDGDVVSTAWDFGDGTGATCDPHACTYSDGTVEPGDGGLAQPSHAYGDEGTYVLRVQAEDHDGARTNASRTVVVDGTPPVTEALVDRAPDVDGWYTDPVEVTLSAWDALGTPTRTRYRVEDGPARTYSSPLRFDRDGEYALAYGSWDAAGNVEETGKLHLSLDLLPPEARFGTRASGFVLVQTASPIEVVASDAASGVQRVELHVNGELRGVDQRSEDGWRFHPHALGLRAGVHELRAVAVDAVGHRTEDRATALVLPVGLSGLG